MSFKNITSPLYFISDNHFQIDTNDDETNRRSLLILLFKEIEKTKGTLIIGGDFLDFWYDYQYNPISSYDDLFAELDSGYFIDGEVVVGEVDQAGFGVGVNHPLNDVNQVDFRHPDHWDPAAAGLG